MEKTIQLSLAGSDIGELKKVRQTLTTEPAGDIGVTDTTITVQPGVIGTTAILTMVLSYLSGVSSKVLGSWIYDKFIKGKSAAPRFEIYINNVKVDTTATSAEAMQEQVENITIKSS